MIFDEYYRLIIIACMNSDVYIYRLYHLLSQRKFDEGGLMISGSSEEQ
jgi:hypothetical protein